MKYKRTINELKYKTCCYSDLGCMPCRVFEGAKISKMAGSRTDSYGFLPICMDSYPLLPPSLNDFLK